MAPKKRPPQAPPAETPGRKKRTWETTQQSTDAGPSVRHTRQQATGAGPSVQPAGPSVPTSWQKKGAKRPKGEPKKKLNSDAIEGEYLVEFEVIPDIERHVRWGYVTGDQRRSALRAVRNRELTASGLLAALDLPVHRPHISACLEFIQTAVTVDPREGVSAIDLPMEATVGGRTVRLDAALVRAAFVLPAASMEIKRQVRHSLIVDWFREPRCIFGRLVYYIKNFKMDPEEDPEDRLDFAELMVQSLRREVLAVRGHLTAIHRSVIWRRLLRLANKAGVEAASKKGFDVLSCLEKSLVVRPGDCLVAFLELLQKRCHIIVWCHASLKYVTAFLGLMVSKGYLPAFMLDPQVCTLWGGDGVETVHPRMNPEDGAKLKSFRRFYDHGIYHFFVLREFWGETPQPVERGIIWDEVPSGRYLYLTTKWPDFYFHRETDGHPQTVSQESSVEEAPTEEAAPVEEAVRVEEAPAEREAPVEEATRVEEALAERAALVEEATRVEEAPAEGAAPVEEATRVEEAPAVGLTHE
ncbi:hypothetical protein R1sor_018486 [Riccia sorocarpa]|uniref:Uncharacterized protein n=1 Tax=Riccia sorocarpa TaxID=122646 RepID=A0ABD3IBH6_9MARC